MTKRSSSRAEPDCLRPAAGDIERIQQTGLQRYIDQQLHPDRIPDEPMRGTALDLRTIGSQLGRDLPPLRTPTPRDAAGASSSRPLRYAHSEQTRQPAAGAGPTAGQRSPRRAERAEDAARDLQRAAAPGSAHRLLVQPFQRRRPEGTRRASCSPSTSARRSARTCSAGSATCSRRRPKVPAMLFYLDNWLSVDPDGPHPAAGRSPRVAARAGVPRMLGRGVPQARANGPGADVALKQQPPRRAQRELRPRADGAAHAWRRRRLHAEGRHRSGARVHRAGRFDPAARAAAFRFEAALHDDGEKVVLGHQIKAGRRKTDGEQVLDLLASHPSTAHFISPKLARRFVSDSPPHGARRPAGGAIPRDRRRPA